MRKSLDLGPTIHTLVELVDSIFDSLNERKIR